jgi:1-acyl-sn-glycerol-3-phosphate acyltransferase
MIGWLSYSFLYSIIRALRLVPFRWKVEGLENLPPRDAGGMIIAMNHVHWLDIPAIGGSLPLRYRLSWLAKSELFRNPLLSWWLRQMLVIPINRGKRDLAALDAAVTALRNGAVLLIYPEGHRSRDGVLLPGRGGAVRLAMQSGMPIVPVGIIGTERGLLGSLTRKPVTLRFGTPYTVAPTADGKIPPELMDQLTTEMMQRIAALLPPARRGPYAQLPAPSSE